MFITTFCKLGLDTQLAIGMGHGGQSPASNLEEDEEYDYDYDYNMVRRRKTPTMTFGVILKWSHFNRAVGIQIVGNDAFK